MLGFSFKDSSHGTSRSCASFLPRPAPVQIFGFLLEKFDEGLKVIENLDSEDFLMTRS